MQFSEEAFSIYSSLVESSGQIALLLGSRGEVKSASVGFQEICGAFNISGEENSIHEWFSDSDRVSEALDQSKKGGSPVYVRTFFHDPSRDKRELVMCIQPLWDSGGEHNGHLLLAYDLNQPEKETPDVSRAEDLSRRIVNLQESLADVNRRLAETALQLAEERYKRRATMASFGQGMLVLDAEGRIEELGGTAEQLLETGKKDLIGKPLVEICPDLAESLQKTLGEAGKAFESLSGRVLKDLRFDHNNKVLRANLSPIVDPEGTELGTVVIFEDFTQISEVDRMKNELISIVSHELRTPLASIKGYLDLVMESGESLDKSLQEEYLGIVQNNTVRLMEMVDVMLDIARIESGRLRLTTEPVDLKYVCHYVYSTFRQAAEDKKIAISVDVPEETIAVVDMDRMIQVFSNLVSNAVKYSPDGGAIEIKGGSDQDQAIIEVVDSGIGISEEDQKHLFEKFYRVSGASKAKGTGLGLSIARSLVEAHGGTLDVSSEPGKGSCFRVVLPVRSQE